jgi:hypothetical protein
VIVEAEEGDAELRSPRFSSAGRVIVRHLREARYSVVATFPAGSVASTHVNVPESREVVLREPPCGRIECDVVGGEELVLILDASRPGVSKADRDAWIGRAYVEIDETGKAIVPRFPAGEVLIRIMTRGFVLERRFRSGDGPAATQHTASLEAGKTLQLRLTVEPSTR